MQPKEPKSYPKNKLITAVGIILPVAWNVQGNPIRVALSTNDEQEYVIDRRSRKGREVAKLLREQVQIEGVLNDKGSIIVKHYKHIDYENSGTLPLRSGNIIDVLLPILIIICMVMI